MSLVEQYTDQKKETPPRYIVRSEVNQRENNEDSFLIYDLYLPANQQSLRVLSIADGMGGHAFGEDASREALRKVSLVLFEQLCVSLAMNDVGEARAVTIEDIVRVMKEAIEQANAHVLRMVRNNNWEKAGSTIAVAAILGTTAVVVNLGDSPVFHYQYSANTMKKVTDDHTVAGALMRRGKITPEMARHHEGRSRLDFFVGIEKLPHKLPIHTIELASEDLLLLCTDGVSGTLLNKQIEELLDAPNGELDVVAQRLIEAALLVGETDNQTLILWQQGMMREKQVEAEIEEIQDKLLEKRVRLGKNNTVEIDMKAVMTINMKEGVDEEISRLYEERKVIDEDRIAVNEQKRILEEYRKDFDVQKLALDEEQRIIEDDKRVVAEQKTTLEKDRVTIAEQKKMLEDDRLAVDEQKTTLEKDRTAFDEQKKMLEDDKLAVDEQKTTLEKDRAAFDEQKKMLEDDRKAVEDEKKRLARRWWRRGWLKRKQG
jgi:protein phosphatase